MHVDGRCHCGQISFTAEVDPAAATICHCTDCQTTTGSAFRANVMAPGATFKLLSGTPASYIKTADSGNRRLQAFCGNCGTALWSSAEHNPTSYVLRTGVLAQRAALRPARQIWRRSALPWVDTLGSLPATDRG